MQQKFANTDNNSSRYKTISNLQGTQNNQERNKKIHKEEKDEEASPPKAQRKEKKTSSTGQAVGYSNRSKRGFVIEQNPS
jgi:hypothetical protein